MILYLRRDDDPPPELVGDEDLVVDIRESVDIDALIDHIFEAEIVVVW